MLPGPSICRGIATLWGFAEATLFFVVPDVYLTLVALSDRRRSLVAILYAAGGALVGGALMYAWGAVEPATAIAFIDRIPAISQSMIEGVGGDLETDGLWAMFVGSVTGTPYKVYAVQSGTLGIPFVTFLVVSLPARLVRFALVTGIAAWLAHGPLARRSVGAKRRLHAGVWIVVYAIYFSIFL